VGEYLGSKPEGYIEKPVDAERLLKTIKRILDKQR
jgi:DNA-binding NtrC family response regulator